MYRPAQTSALQHLPRRSAAALTRLVVALVLVTSAWMPVSAPSAAALVRTSITIDGNLSDWIGVDTDPSNVCRDTQIPDDPDYPGQPDRDVYLVRATSDAEYLYFSWRRTAGGTKAITWGAYIDRDADGLLQNSDKLVVFTTSTGNPQASWNGGKSPSAYILRYNQARDSLGQLLYPSGDPMGYDGETPDGWAQIQSGYDVPAKQLDAYMDPVTGVECEARVAWSDLGLPANAPVIVHFATGNGASFGVPNKPSNTHKWTGSPPQWLEENRGQVEDNVQDLLYFLQASVSVTPDRTGGAAAGTTVVYPHTVTNTGNVADTYSLSATSSAGFPLVVRDAAGIPVTSLSLAGGASALVYLSVQVPGGTTEGTRDRTTLTASSSTRPFVAASCLDVTTVGRVTITPEQSGSMAPGQTIEYRFTVQNNETSTVSLDLSTTSSMGFTRTVVSANGTPLSSLQLASGEATTVVVRVAVPGTATNGQQDIMRLLATSAADPTLAAGAIARTTVREALTVAPARTGYGSPGTALSYRHTLTNSWPATQTVTLSALSSQGWPVAFFDADGVTPITQLAVGPNGASREFVTRVSIPAGASQGAQEYTTVSASASGRTASLTDLTTVRRLATFDSAGYSRQTASFVLGQTVFARSTGLRYGDDVYFVWKDPTGAIVRTGSTHRVDALGMAFDALTLQATDTTGVWAVETYDARSGTLLDRENFNAAFAAEVTALSATDAATVGALTTVTSTASNLGVATIANSTMTYLIWWDQNGNGSFDAGDIWIDSAGAPHTYAGTGSPSTHVTSGIPNVPGGGSWSDPGWSIGNSQFPNQGTYNVTATWTAAGGQLLDTKTTQFFSVPTLGEWAASLSRGDVRPALPFLLVAALLWALVLVRLRASRRWLSFYALGALGTVLFTLFFAQAGGVDALLESVEARQVADLARSLQLNIALVNPSGLAVQNHVGWGVFDIGIECSALLELATLVGLVCFYPAFSPGRKTTTALIGLAATYAINIFRILLIVGIISWLGTGWVFVAHAVIGRLFFFVGVVVVFWYLMTRPTLGVVRSRLEADDA